MLLSLCATLQILMGIVFLIGNTLFLVLLKPEIDKISAHSARIVRHVSLIMADLEKALTHSRALFRDLDESVAGYSAVLAGPLRRLPQVETNLAQWAEALRTNGEHLQAYGAKIHGFSDRDWIPDWKQGKELGKSLSEIGLALKETSRLVTSLRTEVDVSVRPAMKRSVHALADVRIAGNIWEDSLERTLAEINIVHEQLTGAAEIMNIMPHLLLYIVVSFYAAALTVIVNGIALRLLGGETGKSTSQQTIPSHQ